MKKIIKTKLYFIKVIFIIYLLVSCRSQLLDKELVKGNWRIVSDFDKNIIYHEMFVGDSSVYFYDINLGIKPRNKYYIKNNTMFISILGSEYEKIQKIKLDGNLLKITGKNYKLTFKKLAEQNVLERLVSGQISRDTFWSAYLKRYKKWGNDSSGLLKTGNLLNQSNH